MANRGLNIANSPFGAAVTKWRRASIVASVGSGRRIPQHLVPNISNLSSATIIMADVFL